MKINMKNIPLFRRTDLIVIAVLLLAAGLLFMWNGLSEDGKTAIVSLNGEAVRIIDLEKAEDDVFQVGSVTVEVKNGKVSVTDSDCPDKTCVRTGEISKSGEAVVCVPNKVSIEIIGEKSEEDIDILSY